MREPAPDRPDGLGLRLCQRLLRLATLLAPRGVRRRYAEEMLEVSLAGLKKRSRTELALAVCRELAGLVVLAIGARFLGPFPRTTRRCLAKGELPEGGVATPLPSTLSSTAAEVAS